MINAIRNIFSIGVYVIIILVIGKDLPLYKGIGSYGCHGVAPVGKLVSQ
jgi:hypothetical protein